MHCWSTCQTIGRWYWNVLYRLSYPSPLDFSFKFRWTHDVSLSPSPFLHLFLHPLLTNLPCQGGNRIGLQITILQLWVILRFQWLLDEDSPSPRPARQGLLVLRNALQAVGAPGNEGRGWQAQLFYFSADCRLHLWQGPWHELVVRQFMRWWKEWNLDSVGSWFVNLGDSDEMFGISFQKLFICIGVFM